MAQKRSHGHKYKYVEKSGGYLVILNETDDAMRVKSPPTGSKLRDKQVWHTGLRDPLNDSVYDVTYDDGAYYRYTDRQTPMDELVSLREVLYSQNTGIKPSADKPTLKQYLDNMENPELATAIKQIAKNLTVVEDHPNWNSQRLDDEVKTIYQTIKDDKYKKRRRDDDDEEEDVKGPAAKKRALNKAKKEAKKQKEKEKKTPKSAAK